MDGKDSPEKDLTTWSIPVPRALDALVEEAVRRGIYMTKSDLIRDAVRRLLDQGRKTVSPD